MMNYVWVLSVKTSLPNTCASHADLPLTTTVYDSFEKARAALRELLKGYAFSKNSMFDGDGRLPHFQKFIKNCFSEKEHDLKETRLSKEKLEYISDTLRRIFAGEDVHLALAKGAYADYLTCSARCDENFFSMLGDFGGPFNGTNPRIQTNMFSMKQEQHYFLYLDDMFGQDDYSSELYIDLTRGRTQFAPTISL